MEYANDLDRLAAEFGTDKSTVKIGRLSAKGYSVLYYRYFAHMRTQPIRLLEIGVAEGASLRMWEAFFPNAAIYGLDNSPRCAALSQGRIKVFVGDQGDAKSLRSVVAEMGGEFDIIIDDGGHEMRQQQVSLIELFPCLRPAGTYVIEDLHTSYWARYGGRYLSSRSTIEVLKGLVDGLNAGAIAGRKRPLIERFNAVRFRRRQRPYREILHRLQAVHFYPSIAFLLTQ